MHRGIAMLKRVWASCREFIMIQHAEASCTVVCLPFRIGYERRVAVVVRYTTYS